MSLGKVKIAMLSSGVAILVVGGILMAAVPAFASSNGFSSPTPASSTTSTKKEHPHPHWLQAILQKNVVQVAKDLNITKQELVKDLTSGKSLDDIATSSKITQSQLESGLQTIIQNDLQARVAAQHMTSSREAKLQKNLDNQLSKFMANKHIMRKPNKFTANINVLNFVATELHLTRSQLISQLKSGKSINQIATAQGVSPSKLQGDITQKLDTQVNSKVGKLLNKTGWFQHKVSVLVSATNNS